MKRVRCPRCDQYTFFDETKYESGQSLVFQCPQCGKEFGRREPWRETLLDYNLESREYTVLLILLALQ
jgi:transposase-like protein